MTPLRIILEEPAWPDLHEDPGQPVEVISIDSITALEHGMQSGKPSIAIRINCADGKVVIGQTSAALLYTAVDALRAKYPAT